VKRRSFRLEQDLIDAVDAVSGHVGLNRTQYLRRALRSAIYGDASLLNAKLRSPIVRSFLKNLATEISRRKERSKTNHGSRLSLRDQLKGVRAALRSDRTPPQLKAGLRKRAAQLEKTFREEPNA
jgi:hypothetical protein